MSKSTELNNNNACFIDYVKGIETRCSRRINSVTTDVASCPPDYKALSQRNLKRKTREGSTASNGVMCAGRDRKATRSGEYG